MRWIRLIQSARRISIVVPLDFDDGLGDKVLEAFDGRRLVYVMYRGSL